MQVIRFDSILYIYIFFRFFVVGGVESGSFLLYSSFCSIFVVVELLLIKEQLIVRIQIVFFFFYTNTHFEILSRHDFFCSFVRSLVVVIVLLTVSLKIVRLPNLNFMFFYEGYIYCRLFEFEVNLKKRPNV